MARTSKEQKTSNSPNEETPRLRLEWIEAGTLVSNPENWRKHNSDQLASLKEVIEDPEIGWAGAALFNERTKRLIDGHARQQITDPKTLIPVLIGSWSEAAERKILATLDPLSAMATADTTILRELLNEVQVDQQSLANLLDGLAGPEELLESTELKPIDLKPPPKLTWVLIGIPTVRFGEINQQIEQLATVRDIILETTSNDGPKD